MGDHSIPKGKGPALHGGGASKWEMKEFLFSRAEVAGNPSVKGRNNSLKLGECGAVLLWKWRLFCMVGRFKRICMTRAVSAFSGVLG